jgi:transcriptional regulator with XRE-family HTH domain
MQTESVNRNSGPADFRKFLQAELVRRCEKNPRYSMRAFAMSLNIHFATLSSIMSGKRALTPKTIQKLCDALNLNPRESQRFLSDVKGPRSYTELSLDVFSVISDWYHDAILELTHIKRFKPDRKWIARTLGITVAEVNIAVERLIHLDLLEISPNGKWVDTCRSNTNNSDFNFTAVALRKYQKKILELSMTALLEVPRERRDHTSLMVSMDRRDLATVKEKIKTFRGELAQYLERNTADHDAVYQFAFSLFPISRGEDL